MGSEDIVIDNYRIISGLGSGAFGLVYKVQHLVFTDRMAALKLLRLDYLEDPEACVRFLTDAQILNKLQHKYILPIIHAGLYQGVPFQVTEYATQGSLRDRLQRHQSKPLQVAEAITILSQVGQALQFAHEQNIIHRDLKPENILFNEKGDALLADFGIATILSSGTAKHTNAIGTLEYMAPEEFQDITAKESDQYALGCIAYELFTGHKPFEASNPAAIIAKHLMELPTSPRYYNPEIPEVIENVVLKALAKKREDRHKDVTAFITGLIQPHSISSKASNPTSKLADSRSNSQTNTNQEVIYSSPPKTVTSFINQGLMLKDAGRYNEALTAFEQALQLDKYNAMIWAYKGEVLQKLDRLEEALYAHSRVNELKREKIEEDFEEDRDFEDYYDFDLDVNEEDYDVFKSNSESYHNFEDHPTSNKLIAIPKKNDHLTTNLAETLFENCVALTSQERYQEALAVIEQFLNLKPDFIQGWHNKGVLLQVLSRYEEALLAYKHVLEFDRDFILSYIGRGEIFLHLKRYIEALTEFMRASQIDPSNAFIWSGIGASLLELNCAQDSLAAYEKALTFDKTLPDIHIGMGRAYRKLQRFKEALNAYHIAEKLSPNSPDIYHNRGNVLLDLRLYSEALNSFEHEISLSPTEDAFTCKGNALRGLQRYKEALEAHEYAIKLAPNFTLAYINKGNVLLELERYEDALVSYIHASLLSPNYANVYFGKSRALMYLERFEEALTEVQKCIYLNPEHANAYFVQGIILKSLTHFNEALISLNRAIKLFPGDASYYELKGDILFELKQYTEAVTTYSLTIQLNNLNAYAYYKKGCALLELRELEEAIKVFDFATKIVPNFALAYLQTGFILCEQKRYQDALVTFRFVIGIDSTIPAAYMGESLALSNLKNHRQSLKSIEKAIRLAPKSAILWNYRGEILTHLNRNNEAQKAFEYAKYLDQNSFL